MRAALLLALLPTPVAAQYVDRLGEGVSVEGSKVSMLTLDSCILPCVAVVRLGKTLVRQGLDHGPGSFAAMQASLSIAGVTTGIQVENAIGFTPDLMQVLPSAGHAAGSSGVGVDDDAGVGVAFVPMS